jgi:hypothetical protein
MTLQNSINNQPAGALAYEGGQLLLVLPANTTTLSSVGTVISTSASTVISTPTLAATNTLTSTRRTTFSGAATAGSVIYMRQSALIGWRGNNAFKGGFRLTWRFGVEQLVAGQRFFVGLADTINNPTNVDPLTSPTIGKIGIAANTNTGNWQLVNNAAGTAPTVTNLGANFLINPTDILELTISALPGSSNIDATLVNKSTGNSVTVSITANIFPATTFFAPVIWMTNNATAATFAFTTSYLKFTTPN